MVVRSGDDRCVCHRLLQRLALARRAIIGIYFPPRPWPMTNQQRFSFRWVFQEAIPALLPQWLRDQVVFFMKDGDQQQWNEILGATNVFVNAVEGTCGFHVVNMGRKKHVPPIGISNLNLKI